MGFDVTTHMPEGATVPSVFFVAQCDYCFKPLTGDGNVLYGQTTDGNDRVYLACSPSCGEGLRADYDSSSSRNMSPTRWQGFNVVEYWMRVGLQLEAFPPTVRAAVTAALEGK